MPYLVSVVIPAYNVSSYIYHCLSSVASQTYKFLEIIVVNDGSTDDTLSICIGFAAFDDRVKVVNQANTGLVSARKAGVSVASGDFILNVDGDDWLPPDSVRLLVEAAALNHSDIVIASFYREFIGSLSLIHPLLPEGYYSKSDITKQVLPKMIYDYRLSAHGVSTYSWGKLFRLSLYKEIQDQVPNNISLGEDSLCTYPFIACCNGLEVIHQSVYFYRQRSSSMLKACLSPVEELKYIASFADLLRLALAQVSHYVFTSQIHAYHLRLASERTALCFVGDSIDPRFVDNHSLDKSRKISVFSSGTFGRRLYATLPNYGYQVDSLFDEDYHESIIGRVDVLPPCQLSLADFDFLLIAAWSSNSIKHALSVIHKHVPDLDPGSLVRVAKLDTTKVASLSLELPFLTS